MEQGFPSRRVFPYFGHKLNDRLLAFLCLSSLAAPPARQYKYIGIEEAARGCARYRQVHVVHLRQPSASSHNFTRHCAAH
jgi:hypothetical protein